MVKVFLHSNRNPDYDSSGAGVAASYKLPYAGAETQALVPCKSSECFLIMEPSFQPLYFGLFLRADWELTVKIRVASSLWCPPASDSMLGYRTTLPADFCAFI